MLWVPHLAGAEDEPVVVLRAMVLVVVQLLPPDANSYRPQRLVQPKVVPVVWGQKQELQESNVMYLIMNVYFHNELLKMCLRVILNPQSPCSMSYSAVTRKETSLKKLALVADCLLKLTMGLLSRIHFQFNLPPQVTFSCLSTVWCMFYKILFS